MQRGQPIKNPHWPSFSDFSFPNNNHKKDITNNNGSNYSILLISIPLIILLGLIKFGTPFQFRFWKWKIKICQRWQSWEWELTSFAASFECFFFLGDSSPSSINACFAQLNKIKIKKKRQRYFFFINNLFFHFDK